METGASTNAPRASISVTDGSNRKMSSVSHSPSSGKTDPEAGKKESKCSPTKAKNCIKTFIAKLFSHVGLCALVIGYSLMGAVIFVSLEKENELATRDQVSSTRNNTLEELYNITGKTKKYVKCKSVTSAKRHERILYRESII